jgi:hypothetical protein
MAPIGMTMAETVSHMWRGCLPSLWGKSRARKLSGLTMREGPSADDAGTFWFEGLDSMQATRGQRNDTPAPRQSE